ncbi:DNA polymerase epsilon subunit 3 [Micractinium conductrix]|uniref:DNA polymerase epsilon subunit 3 n=1 Tax=Micractinium conductrix TaxID=554055 RepID=A0A2P6VA09_9CHLO|nr:DNA polymerase epsilon subunit 3 [Micractinium conductrix]|eukprot:PSC70901.1 DNA polymerase epsilon subunit 3 [Micractinium conductrix]
MSAEALASPDKAAEAGGGGGGEADAELPRALMKRILKARLAQWDAEVNGGDGTRDFQVSKDALLACCEAGKLFIHYLAATANDACRDAKRQTVSADDVLTALEDLEFGELTEPLKAALDAYKAEAKAKTQKKTEQTKKRKADKGAEEPSAQQQQQQQQQDAGGAAAMEADGAD